MLGLRFCARAFSSCGERGPPTVVASLVAKHRLQTHRLSSCGSRAQLLCGMWDPPRPGLEPVSPALAGRFSTTAPPGKPDNSLLSVRQEPTLRPWKRGPPPLPPPPQQDYQFVIKGYNPGTATWKRCVGQGMGKGHRLPCPLQAHHSPSPSTFSLTWKLSRPVLWGFMKASLPRHID